MEHNQAATSILSDFVAASQTMLRSLNGRHRFTLEIFIIRAIGRETWKNKHIPWNPYSTWFKFSSFFLSENISSGCHKRFINFGIRCSYRMQMRLDLCIFNVSTTSDMNTLANFISRTKQPNVKLIRTEPHSQTKTVNSSPTLAHHVTREYLMYDKTASN